MDPPRSLSVCSHLLAKRGSFHVWFTGKSTECCWVCPDCAKADAPPADLARAPEQLLELLEKEQWWAGIRGTPGISTRDAGLSFAHQNLRLIGTQTSEWIDVQPDLTTAGAWWILVASGKIGRLSTGTGEFETMWDLDELGFPVSPTLALRISPAGDFAAVFQNNDRLGRVFNLRTGQSTTSLDRGDYEPDTSFFPIAFFSSPTDGKTLLMTATAWNRLDIIDPSDGELLTARDTGKYSEGQAPPHYLDYFHASLCISPANQWIADAGWVWHPVGVIRTWSLKAWIEDNAWESEDGTSVQGIAVRDYFWDGPSCWVSETTLAVWGLGRDDQWLIPGMVLFDVRTGNQLRWFPGPSAKKPGWPREKEWPSLYFDEFLFAIDGQSGLAVWDAADGSRLLEEPALNPIGYHPVSKEFLSLTEGGIRLSRLTK